MPFIGELIAITTVLCWTVSVQCFGAASKDVGAAPVNIIRLTVAIVLFTLLMLVREGVPLPLDFPFEAWVILGLSGVVGFFIGDIFLFKALVELGPRLTMLIYSLAAPTSAVIGWLFLAESYRPYQWLGMLVTLAGVGLVIFEKNSAQQTGESRRVTRLNGKGLVFAGMAMLGQAGGFVLSKVGMDTGDGYLDAFAATQVRALAAWLCFVVLFSVTGRWAHVRIMLRHRRAMVLTVSGSFLGPFLGVSLSLLTLHYLATGVAATILSLVPVMIIPFSVYLHKEYVSVKAVAGAFIAVFGIYLLMI